MDLGAPIRHAPGAQRWGRVVGGVFPNVFIYYVCSRPSVQVVSSAQASVEFSPRLARWISKRQTNNCPFSDCRYVSSDGLGDTFDVVIIITTINLITNNQ